MKNTLSVGLVRTSPQNDTDIADITAVSRQVPNQGGQGSRTLSPQVNLAPEKLPRNLATSSTEGPLYWYVTFLGGWLQIAAIWQLLFEPGLQP